MTVSHPEDLARHEEIRTAVRRGYGAVAVADPAAREEASCCGPTCCGGQAATAEQLAGALGYDATDLAAVPDGANMGLSCGNPTALAALREGEVVLDLGAGGGFDVFIAGRKVGARGRVLGVDMTPEMLAKARANVAAYHRATGLSNVEFRLGEIEHLPVADASVDVVISNCVINLSPDKPQVYREIARVLRPGGRLAVSDIVLKRPLPAAVARDVAALVGCVAGAMTVGELRAAVAQAGLADLALVEKRDYVAAMEASKDHIAAAVRALLPAGETIGDYIASMDIAARKPEPAAAPRTACCG